VKLVSPIILVVKNYSHSIITEISQISWRLMIVVLFANFVGHDYSIITLWLSALFMSVSPSRSQELVLVYIISVHIILNAHTVHENLN